MRKRLNRHSTGSTAEPTVSDRGRQHEYLVAWSEHSQPHVIYSTTRDFKSFQRDPRGYASWGGTDGLISVWREGQRLYLFAGHSLHEMALP